MYLMNKVRCLPEKTLYEIIDFDINTPSSYDICTVTRAQLDNFLQKPSKDFAEENGYLISSAETVKHKLFDEEKVRISITTDLFDLLMELVQKGAFCIPSSVFQENKDYAGEEVASFPNIRVSSSSMYIGFSVRHNDSWASSKILYAENGQLFQKSFYIALPSNFTISSCNLKKLGTATVNGRICDIYKYDQDLPIIGEVSLALYVPLPLINYLNLQYSRCFNAFRFFSDLFDEKGILSAAADYDPTPAQPQRAVTVSSSIKNSSKKRREELSHYYRFFDGELSTFVDSYKLNPLEHYTFILLSKVKSLKTSEELFNLMKLLRVNRSLYALTLMMYRTLIFNEPTLFFPEHFNQLIARGGGGGDAFVTSIELNNY